MTALEGKTALVSGASRGIGFEIARALASAGMRVAVIARSADVLRENASAIGARVLPFPCDVGDAKAVERMSRDVKAAFAGAPDVLVNNAGVFQLAAIDQIEPDDFRHALDVNLVAPFLLVRAFLGEMKARRAGHVVTIGSIADRTAFAENGSYAASKFGLRALHEVLRSELRDTGVRATLVSPAAVDTALWDPVAPDTKPGFTPRRAMLHPSDVAAAVLYAVSQPASVNVDELRLSHS